ncbi:hypothetical protein J5226_18905 [Lysobacter sp. K5869]|uniref:site-2 protease family protein n=1 Tax=Lysobacter sp. K5869 TaxID=2820808 RepID=UPI001C06174D|nr:site-2 protease family protein [Lysobacter sp. K5869]QWP75660.1 hypothetical protein J5226_18905 [Lysobacter sp. K5869]
MSAAADSDRSGEPARAAAPAPPRWRDLSPGWLRACRFVAVWAGAAIFVVGAIAFLAISSHPRFNFALTLSLVVIPGFVLAVAVHEGGHWLAARWRGMAVQSAVVLWCELQPRRRGLRARWTHFGGGWKEVGGFVSAYPPPGRNRREDWIWVYLGGAAANLVAAAAFACAAWAVGRSSMQVVWLLLALLQLVGALNLIPCLTVGGIANDGLSVARLLRNRLQDLPGMTLLEMNSHLVHGTAFADLPPGLRERLAAEPEPTPLLCEWLDVYAALERDDGEQAQAAFERLCEREDAAALADLLAIAQADIAFQWALREPDAARAAAGIDALASSSSGFWYVPQFAPRLRALAAALRGDGANMESLLRISQRYADNDPWPTRRAAEAQARDAVRAAFAARGDSPAHQETS